MIKLQIGDFEFVIGVFSIEDWGFRIEDWGKINMGKTQFLIQSHQLVIFITNWSFPPLVNKIKPYQ